MVPILEVPLSLWSSRVVIVLIFATLIGGVAALVGLTLCAGWQIAALVAPFIASAFVILVAIMLARPKRHVG